MSRCFPYPPPAYSGNEALIESIKLQREREKAKSERKREKKEKKREKKERRKEKKLTLASIPPDETCQKLEKRFRYEHKSKLVEDNPNELTKSGLDETHQKFAKSFQYFEGESKSKIVEDNLVELTESGLTEEHGQPINSIKPSYSSDSTQNSNKRKRPASPFKTPQTNGNTFRIRLPMQKHKGPAASSSKEDPCSTSGRTIIHAQHKHDVAKEAIKYRDVCSPPLVKDSLAKKLIARPELKGPVGKAEIFLNDTTLTLARTDNSVISTTKAEVSLQDKTPVAFRLNSSATNGKAEISGPGPKDASKTSIEKDKILVQDKRSSSGSTSSHDKLKRAGKQYTDLFKNWVPQPLEIADDQEWLFGGKRPKREEEEKRIEGSDHVSSCSSFALQSVARYLPVTNIYSLPYTVPF